LERAGSTKPFGQCRDRRHDKLGACRLPHLQIILSLGVLRLHRPARADIAEAGGRGDRRAVHEPHRDVAGIVDPQNVKREFAHKTLAYPALRLLQMRQVFPTAYTSSSRNCRPTSAAARCKVSIVTLPLALRMRAELMKTSRAQVDLQHADTAFRHKKHQKTPAARSCCLRACCAPPRALHQPAGTVACHRPPYLHRGEVAPDRPAIFSRQATQPVPDRFGCLLPIMPYGALPRMRTKHSRTFCCVSSTWACSAGKSGRSAARASRPSTPTLAVVGSNFPGRQRRRICVRS
jgi:hypothetical protein